MAGSLRGPESAVKGTFAEKKKRSGNA